MLNPAFLHERDRNKTLRTKKVDRDYDQKELYLNGIRKFRNRGIRILFDGKEIQENEWKDLFLTSENGGFYRCDYHKGTDGCLAEIHFDWVYNMEKTREKSSS